MDSAYILAAEDDDFTRDMLDTIIGSTGIKFDLAVDGEDAVSKFKAKGGAYTIVLLDLQMPKKDGHGAAKDIRAIESSSGWKKSKMYGLSAGKNHLIKTTTPRQRTKYWLQAWTAC